MNGAMQCALVYLPARPSTSLPERSRWAQGEQDLTQRFPKIISRHRRYFGALNTSFSQRESRRSRPSFEPYLSRSSLISFTSAGLGASGWTCAFLFDGIWNLLTVIATFWPAGDSTKSIHFRAPCGF